MAIYNSGFPMTYPQMYPQMQTPYQQTISQISTSPQTNQQNSSISWVQGEAGAKAYPVAAGNTVMLLDSEDSVFYLKSTDLSGMPQPLRIFDFKERVAQTVSQNTIQPNLGEYVTRSELEMRLSQLVNKPEPRKEVVDNE